jgi:hypothetical protein
MANKIDIKSRSTSRVEETEGKSSGTVTKAAAHRGRVSDVVPEGMIEICAQGSELVPVAQYANVTIGPIYARRLIVDPGLDKLVDTDPKNWDAAQNAIADRFQNSIRVMQDLLEEIMAEDRVSVLESVREVNKRKAEEDGKK